MPKPTFFNLPEHKRQLIFQHALTEFANHPYEQASLSEIVSKTGIAKGSMYQYFEDKCDLYMYVLEQAYAKKRGYLSPVWAQRGQLSFFDLVSEYYRRSWHFARENPQAHRVIANFWDSRHNTVRSQILHEREVRTMEFFDLLEDAIRNGDVDAELDSEAAWFVYHAVGKAIIDNFLEVQEESDHEQFIGQVLRILERGLKVRKETVND